jgi:osmoprotectant transport system substrate-binding protein
MRFSVATSTCNWEYTGTAWVWFVGQQPIQNSKAQYEAVKDLDLAQNEIVWLQPTPFNNIYSFALKRSAPSSSDCERCRDMAAYIPSDQPGNMCIESVYLNRDDGFPGLQRTYGFQVPSDRLQVLQTGAIYQATTIRRVPVRGGVHHRRPYPQLG